jgi:hypothetical protein
MDFYLKEQLKAEKKLIEKAAKLRRLCIPMGNNWLSGSEFNDVLRAFRAVDDELAKIFSKHDEGSLQELLPTMRKAEKTFFAANKRTTPEATYQRLQSEMQQAREAVDKKLRQLGQVID